MNKNNNQYGDNNLVHDNIFSGTEKVKSFKLAIQEALYPNECTAFSAGAMAYAKRTIEAFEKCDGTTQELIDLMLFYVECGTQFTNDYGDIDEHFYIELETTFEELLTLIAKNKLLEQYKKRLNSIVQMSRDTGWGYGDQIEDLLDIAFPNIWLG